MALGRLDVPGLILYGGTINPGVYKGERNVTVVSVYEAIGAYRAGKITLDELTEIENVACPGPGACGGQYTANTMSTVMEFIGLSPAGLNGIPAEGPAKDAAAYRSGELVMDLVRRDVRPKHIVTRAGARERHRQRGRDRRLDQRRAPSPGDRPRVRDPARHRRVRGDRRPDAAHRRHAAGRALHRARHVRGGRRRAGHARAAQAARAPPRRRADGRRPDDRPDRRGRRRDARPEGGPPARDAAQAERRAGHPARLARAGRLRGQAGRSRAAPASRSGPRVRLRDRLLRRRPGAADRARRRRRHPLRGAGRRTGHAGDAAGHRARSSARGWAIRSRS